MDVKEQEFLKRLRATFRIEAEEHLRALSAGLIELEKPTEPERRAEIVESIFRDAHSLKGAARSVNLKEVESICQPLESTFAALKRQEIPLAPALFDLLHQAVDSLAQLIANIEGERTSVDRSRARELTRRLADAALGRLPPREILNSSEPMPSPERLRSLEPAPAREPDAPHQPKPPAPNISPERLRSPEATVQAAPKAPIALGKLYLLPPNRRLPSNGRAQPKPVPPIAPPLPVAHPPLKSTPALPRPIVETAPIETVRIPITKLDPLLLQAEEMIQAKLAAAQRAVELREIQQTLFTWKTESAKRREQTLTQSKEVLDEDAAKLEVLSAKVTAVSQAFEQDQRALRHMVDVHLDAMKQVLMLPVSTLVEGFPRQVRDLARNQGKEIDVVVSGAELEIDKRILEDLKDPLTHLVRNCVDHGLEKPALRVQHQKPERGTLTLAFSTKDSRQVEIVVSDDGAGIDLKQVRTAAVKAGLLTNEAAAKLSAPDTLALIFQSSLTTSEIITDISGRGLGLAIVREKVEKLGGTVTVETTLGKGTTFRLHLPLTLATFRGVLVRARGQMFVVPTAQVERAVRIGQGEIQTVENRETIRMDGQVLALVRLGDVLGLAVRSEGLGTQYSKAHALAADHVPVLILSSAEKRLAVQVDEVLAEEEVLVKRLGKQLSRVRNIAGATVLGAGTVVPVLNVSDLLASAVRPGGAVGAPEAIAPTTRIHRILVADDSITARTLLKNILETSGHLVTTAVDGADAFAQFSNGEFDLVVSDVDMPRMSGFELTTKIRADAKWKELPVVLVTALESRQDRERGIEVGANAYIIKSSFDQSNLLEVVRRLL
jgi:two-component system, chemotaxis family, sensor kinase CheA